MCFLIGMKKSVLTSMIVAMKNKNKVNAINRIKYLHGEEYPYIFALINNGMMPLRRESVAKLRKGLGFRSAARGRIKIEIHIVNFLVMFGFYGSNGIIRRRCKRTSKRSYNHHQ